MPPPIGDRALPAVTNLAPDPKSPPPAARRLAWPAALAAAALIAIGVARLRPAPPPAAVEPASSAAPIPSPEPPAPPPAVAVAAPPPAAPEPAPPEPEPAPAPPPAVAAAAPPPAAPEPAPPEPEPEPAPAPPRRPSSGLRIERILTGPTYAHYTCPEPTDHFSLHVHRRVNVCIQIGPMLAPVEETVNVVWERNGAFYGSTELTIPARHIPHRTRVHMAIDERRVGDWSIRVVSRKGKELARSTFQVGP
jgi:hypothetical protein